MTKILVVDDEPDLADSLAMLFDAMGHDARVAYQGHHAVAVTASFQPHIVFLDLSMPVKDGFEAAREIRASRDTDHPFLVALTALSGADIDRQVKNAGFDMYLVKPADTNMLLSIVQNLSGRKHASKTGT